MQSLSSAKNSGKIHTRSHSFRWSFSSRLEKKVPKMTRQQLSLVPRAMLDYALYGRLSLSQHFSLLHFVCVKTMLRNGLGIKEFLFRTEYIVNGSWMLRTSSFLPSMSHRQTCWSKTTHSLTESFRAVTELTSDSITQTEPQVITYGHIRCT